MFARVLQQAIGDPGGEMRVMNQYLFQAWGARGPKKYRDMLLHTGTAEIGHIEVRATAVAMNLDGMPSENVDDAVTNPLVSARMGGVEPRHCLSGGLAAMPADANGVPFNANLHRRRRQSPREHARQRRSRGDRANAGRAVAGDDR